MPKGSAITQEVAVQMERELIQAGRAFSAAVLMPRKRNVLTPRKVKAIRAQYAKGVLQVALAKKYGVTQTQVSRILSGKAWREKVKSDAV